jgi:hypothetical protein
VFAVLRPGLREAFQLHVGCVFIQAEFSAGFDDRGISKVPCDRLHLLEVERQKLFPADFQKRRLVQPGQIDFSHLRLVMACDLRNVRRNAVYKIKLRLAYNLMTLDQIVSEQAGGDVLRIGPGNRAGDQILAGRVDADFAIACAIACAITQKQRNRFARGFADIVGHAGTEPYLDEPVEISGERLIDRVLLDHRVGKRPGRSCAKLAG